MSDINRRDAVKLMGLISATSTFAFACSGEEVDEARNHGVSSNITTSTQPDSSDYERQFFTDHEYETVSVLAAMVIPADERSGSASDAGVPAFIDFIMSDELINGVEQRQTAMRGGLAWLDYQCMERYDGRFFIECSEAERKEFLDMIAYPEQAPAGMEPGVRFFNSFRNLTASGFFSSKMGVEDLGYMGNVPTEWTGCSAEVHDHIELL